MKKDSRCVNSVNDLIKKIKLILQKELLYKEKNNQISAENNRSKFKRSTCDKLKFLAYRSIMLEDNPEKALILINKVFEIDKNDLEALNFKGTIDFYLDEYEKAITCFDKCLERDGNFKIALFNKGMVLRRMRKFSESLECFDKVLEDKRYSLKVRPYQEELLEKLSEIIGVDLI